MQPVYPNYTPKWGFFRLKMKIPPFGGILFFFSILSLSHQNKLIEK